MLYIIKNNKVYMTVSGNYNPDEYREFLTIEDDRTNLVYNPKKDRLEPETFSRIEEPVFDAMELFGTKKPLQDSIGSTPLWAKMIEDGEKSLKLNIAVTLLITAVTSTKNNAGFIQGLQKYFRGLEDTSKASPLTQEELGLLQQLINDSEFEVNLSELEF